MLLKRYCIKDDGKIKKFDHGYRGGQKIQL
jgi:hypothetical protein